MHKLHLVLIYSLLVFVLADRIPDLLAPGQPLALAQTAEAPNRIGPAAALELIDVDDDADDDGEDKRLVVRNDAGRIAWGEHPTSRALSMAVVQAGPIVKDMLMRPQFAEELKVLQRESDDEQNAWVTKMGDVSKKLEGLNRSSPEYRQIYDEYQRLHKEYTTWRDSFIKRRDAVAAKQVTAVYDELVAAVDIVAKRLDIDIVMQARSPSDELSQTDYSKAGWDIALRTILKFPESIDITEQVRDELGI